MKLKLLLVLMFFRLSVAAQERITVYFDFDQFTLNTEASEKLSNWISQTNNIEVSKIYGFCDWKGTNHYNDSLSVKRVNTVVNYLKNKNIKVMEGYEIRGFGEDFEQSKVQSENRKVTIVYSIKKNEVPKKLPVQDDAAEPLEEKIKIAKPGDKIRLRNIKFFNMTPRILPKSKTILYELLCALQDNPKLKVEIQGHICCQFTNDLNGLSVARAKAIYNFLISNKINRNRLSYKGFGTSNPIYPIPEKNEFEEEENRRVEIMIVEN